ncbi:MAG: exopolysaccharide biosynthesis polyprenyl glycosylphosphotransferase [Eubacteriales bacterium]|nr:exopolysaccharide biosynthesis polyprenyl glycosylphosphotransferase [Eubacteriales bacterium]
MGTLSKTSKMHAMNLLHFVLTTGAVSTVWLLWYIPRLGVNNRIFFVSLCIIHLPISIFLYKTFNIYNIGVSRITEVFYSQVLACLFSDAITYMVALVILLKPLSLMPHFIALFVQILICFAWCKAADWLHVKLYPAMKTLIIYQNKNDFNKLQELIRLQRRFDVQKKLEAPNAIEDILPALEGFQAVVISGIPATLRNGIVKGCIDSNINCYFIPHTGDVIIAGAKHLQSFSIPVMSVKRTNLSPEYVISKRVFDIIFSSIGLIVASPFMLLVAIAIKSCDRGPILYKQVRLTKDGKRFNIFKFRSMRVDAEGDGIARLASNNDDRITPVGKFIRAVRADELPQLFNIIKGDMSIVGPRPERPEIAVQYEKDMPAFSLRLQVKAGLTGTAQVYGKYNTEPKDKLKMDLMYINEMSPLTDLKLIFATIKILFMKDSTEGIDERQTTAVSAGINDKSA